MKEDFYIKLIQKDLSGKIAEEERVQLDLWRKASSANDDIANSLYEAWKVSPAYGEDLNVDVAGDYVLLEEKIAKINPQVIRFKRNLWLGLAASFIVVLAAVFLIGPSPDQTIVAPDDGFVLQLPDGTRITMSMESTLTHPRRFGSRRDIVFTGSAKMEVVSDPEKPFAVHSPQATTEVLGTTFYLTDKGIGTTAQVQLVEGRVKVSIPDLDKSVILSPGERMDLEDQDLVVSKGLRIAEFSWIPESLKFSNIPVHEVIETLKMHFGVDISYDSALGSCTFTGNLGSNQHLEILEALAAVYGARLETSGTSYNLSGGQCN